MRNISITFLICKIATSSEGGTVENPEKVTCYLLFETEHKNALFANGDNTVSTAVGIEAWTHNGFEYDSTEEVNEFVETLENAAASVGYKTSDYLKASYGNFATMKEIKMCSEEKFGYLGGFAQQYLFYYARENKLID